MAGLLSIPAFFALAAPCLVVAVAVGRILRPRKVVQTWTELELLPTSTRSTSVHANPTLLHVARELIKSPVPVAPPRRPLLHQRSESIEQQLFHAFAAPAPPGPRVPKLVVTPPDDDKPWTPGYVVPKQNTSGCMLVVPGAPTATAHFRFRLP